MSNTNKARRQNRLSRGHGSHDRTRQAIARYLYDDVMDGSSSTASLDGSRNLNRSQAMDSSSSNFSTHVSMADAASEVTRVVSNLQRSSREDDKTELTEITDKMNNLTSAKYERKFPKHHSGYRNKEWLERKRTRFDDATPISALTEDAPISMQMRYHCSMDFSDAEVLNEDSEYPSTESHSQSRSSNDDANSEDDEEQQVCTRGREKTSRIDNDDAGAVSVGIVSRPKKSVLTKLMPSISTMSRLFFLLGCTLTLWMAVDGLVWAKQQDQRSSLAQRVSTRLRKLSSSTSNLPITHQQQWSKEATQDWSHLQEDQQEAWAELGFDEDAWNDEDAVSSDNIEWEDLTGDQLEAAMELGFSPQVWDHFNGGSASRQDILDNSSPQPQQDSLSSSPSLAPTIGPAPVQSPVPAPTIMPDASKSSSVSDRDHEVFSIAGGNISITKYMILCFVASLCFTMVGLIEWVQHDLLFQLMLAAAGAWGLLASMFLYRNPESSLAFQTLSAHFFLGAASAVLWLRCQMTPAPTTRRSRPRRSAVQTKAELVFLADICFAVGAAMTCVMSYLNISYGIDQTALMVDVQRLNVFASILWVACAAIYFALTYKANQ